MERINHFPFITYGKNLFGILRPFSYKSRDLERIKDVYRVSTVYETSHYFSFSFEVSFHYVSLVCTYDFFTLCSIILSNVICFFSSVLALFSWLL